MTVFTTALDKTDPDTGDPLTEGAAKIREGREQFQERISVDHYIDAEDSDDGSKFDATIAATDDGYHKHVTLMTLTSAGVTALQSLANSAIMYAKTESGVEYLYYQEESDGSAHRIVALDTTDVLTNKTLTAPAINDPVFGGTSSGTYTLAGTITLGGTLAIGAATLSGTFGGTYTLASPTITGATITGGTINNTTIGASTKATALVTTIGINDGSAASPGIFFHADTNQNTGIYRIDENEMGFTVAGVGVCAVRFASGNPIFACNNSNSTLGAEVLKLTQDDTDEEYINFSNAPTSGGPVDSSNTEGSNLKTEAIRISVNGTKRYLRVYANAN